MKSEDKVWFKKRSHGPGWLPKNWLGWLIVFVWLMFVTGGISWLNLVFENVWLAMAVSVVWCGFMLGVLSAVAHLKSGKPKDVE